jgi:hypothetical protein
MFQTEYRGIAWILEYKRLAREKVCGGVASQAKPHPASLPKKAAVNSQQLWRKHALIVLPTHLRRDTAGSAANRVRILYFRMGKSVTTFDNILETRLGWS